MKILLYARPASKDFFLKLIERTFGETNIIMISDFKGMGDIWSGQYIYNEKFSSPILLDNDSFCDIYNRCRFLRSQPKHISNMLITRFWNGVNQLFKDEKFDLVISPLIDCYTMDIIERVSKKQKCPFISPVSHFFNGYSRFTIRGELIRINRSIDKTEVDKVLNTLLQDSYKPNFSINKQISEGKQFKFFVRRNLIDDIYFPLKKKKEGDPLNYHYNTGSFQTRKITDYIGRDINQCLIKINDIKNFNDSVYIPLHYSPEATVDYWCDDSKLAYYEASICNLINNSDKDIRFILKEHPAMLGKRHIKFYQELLKNSNVNIIHPYENSNDLLKRIENVLVYTGSVGVEALLRGKRVFTVTENYYSNLHPNILKIDKVDKKMMDYKLTEYSNNDFIYHLLQGLFKGQYYGDWNINNSDINEISKALSLYLS